MNKLYNASTSIKVSPHSSSTLLKQSNIRPILSPNAQSCGTPKPSTTPTTTQQPKTQTHPKRLPLYVSSASSSFLALPSSGSVFPSAEPSLGGPVLLPHYNVYYILYVLCTTVYNVFRPHSFMFHGRSYIRVIGWMPGCTIVWSH